MSSSTVQGPFTHIFVDESSRTTGKKRFQGYYLAAAVVPTPLLASARLILRDQLRPGRTYFHFTKEQDADRARFLDAIGDTRIITRVYRSPQPKDSQARSPLLAALLADLPKLRTVYVGLEQREEHQNRIDRQVIALNRPASLQSYSHIAKAEPLLWVADAIAWCCGHPDWHTKIREMGLVETAPKSVEPGSKPAES